MAKAVRLFYFLARKSNSNPDARRIQESLLLSVSLVTPTCKVVWQKSPKVLKTTIWVIDMPNNIGYFGLLRGVGHGTRKAAPSFR